MFASSVDFNHIKIKNTSFNFYRALPAAMSVVAMAMASLPPLPFVKANLFLETNWEWETLGGNWR